MHLKESEMHQKRIRNASEMLQKCIRKVRPKSEHSMTKV